MDTNKKVVDRYMKSMEENIASMDDHRETEENEITNVRLLNKLKPGDVVRIISHPHTHCGIYVGYSNIIHLSAVKQRNLLLSPSVVEVVEESLLSVAKNKRVEVSYDHHNAISTRGDILNRARSKLGTQPYSEIFHSCIHFIKWCRNGVIPTTKLPKAVIECHNFNVHRRLEPGDIVNISRGVFSHMGIYVGDSKIIHVEGPEESNASTGFSASLAGTGVNVQSFARIPSACKAAFESSTSSLVLEEDFYEVVKDRLANIANNDRNKIIRPRHLIVSRARSSLGYCQYQALYKNCEHFVNWCRYGVEESEQSQNTIIGLTTASYLGGALVAGPLGGIALGAFTLYKIAKNAMLNTRESE